jgi:Xaa-Pro dipeptidase
MNLPRIQQILRDYSLDAWLLYDFRASNMIAWQTLGLPPEVHCTRRWAVVIPAEGEVVKIVNGIEPDTLSSVDAREIRYANRTDWETALRTTLGSYRRIALEYSPLNAIPIVSRVDAGTVEWLRAEGFDLHSSADVIQQYSAVWTQEQFEENKTTAKLLRTAMMRAWNLVRERLLRSEPLTEYDVQQYVVQFFAENNLTSYSAPSVSVNANSANAHYQPTATSSAQIQRGDTVLIDMWAKQTTPNSVYSDITWMGYVGEEVAARPAELFRIIAAGRDAAVEHLRTHFSHGSTVVVRGCDLDDVCREVIENAGYGQYFIHRTGHSITTETHGSGANIDNFETNDVRPLIPMTSFSIEPGVYIPSEIGLRTEIDIVIAEDGEIIVSGGAPQREVLPLLRKDLDIEALMNGDA